MSLRKLRPSDICFSQDSIGNKFNDQCIHRNKYIAETLDDICEGRCNIESIPTIRVVSQRSRWISADNRRLWVFRQLEALGKCDTIVVKEVRRINPSKLTASNGGLEIRVRGSGPNSTWLSKPKVNKDLHSSSPIKESSRQNRYQLSNNTYTNQPSKSNLFYSSQHPSTKHVTTGDHSVPKYSPHQSYEPNNEFAQQPFTSDYRATQNPYTTGYTATEQVLMPSSSTSQQQSMPDNRADEQPSTVGYRKTHRVTIPECFAIQQPSTSDNRDTRRLAMPEHFAIPQPSTPSFRATQQLFKPNYSATQQQSTPDNRAAEQPSTIGYRKTHRATIPECFAIQQSSTSDNRDTRRLAMPENNSIQQPTTPSFRATQQLFKPNYSATQQPSSPIPNYSATYQQHMSNCDTSKQSSTSSSSQNMSVHEQTRSSQLRMVKEKQTISDDYNSRHRRNHVAKQSPREATFAPAVHGSVSPTIQSSDEEPNSAEIITQKCVSETTSRSLRRMATSRNTSTTLVDQGLRGLHIENTITPSGVRVPKVTSIPSENEQISSGSCSRKEAENSQSKRTRAIDQRAHYQGYVSNDPHSKHCRQAVSSQIPTSSVHRSLVQSVITCHQRAVPLPTTRNVTDVIGGLPRALAAEARSHPATTDTVYRTQRTEETPAIRRIYNEVKRSAMVDFY